MDSCKQKKSVTLACCVLSNYEIQMYLVTAATEFELKPFEQSFGASGAHRMATLVTGVGPVEAAIRLTRYLSVKRRSFDAVINIGTAGAYIRENGAGMLSICLAESEVLGDLGVCLQDRVEPIQGEGLLLEDTFFLNPELCKAAITVLDQENIPYRVGKFITVSCVTGTDERAAMLTAQYQGLCENMEGAAAARVCQEFSLPLLEMRCVSNMVEKRNTEKWQLKQACIHCGTTAATLVKRLLDDTH